MPADELGDADHLALASFYNCDMLVTWNCRRLANANKVGHIQRVNALLGLRTPLLVTHANVKDIPAIAWFGRRCFCVRRPAQVGSEMTLPAFEDLPFYERPDLTPFLLHLTRAANGQSGFDNLVEILRTGKSMGVPHRRVLSKGLVTPELSRDGQRL